MEGDFRNTLIIISAVIIVVIFIHGFITIRKNKNPYKLKATNEKIEPVKRGFDGSGFDQDGVSKPRVVDDKVSSSSVKNDDKLNSSTLNESDSVDLGLSSLNISENETTHNISSTESIEDDFQYDVKEETEHSNIATDISLTDSGLEHLGSDTKKAPSDLGDDLTDFDYGVNNKPDLFTTNEESVEEINKTVVIQTPLYDTPITQPKPERKKPITSTVTAKTAVKKKTNISKKEAIKRNQIELNFGDPIDTSDMPSMSAIDDESKAEKQKKLEPLEPEVLVISIVMPEGQVISGAALLPTLLTLGLRYGDMDIFHRHQDNAGNGKVTFSLANIMNPGTFDLDALETFSTCGLTFFMTLPNAGDAFEVFEHMIGAAKQISTEFGAQLLDDKRSVMTKQTEQHYMSKIREFERKNRIAISEINA